LKATTNPPNGDAKLKTASLLHRLAKAILNWKAKRLPLDDVLSDDTFKKRIAK